MVAAGDEIVAADITELEDYTIRKPLGRLVASGAQTLADNTVTAIAFSAEDRDTHNFHDTAVNNTRVTPTIAGYYRVYGTLFMSSLVNGTTIEAGIRLIGGTTIAPAGRLGGAAGHGVTTSGSPSTVGTANAFGASCTVQIECNGTTDYFELVGRQDSNGSDDTNQSSQFSSVLEWEFLRPV